MHPSVMDFLREAIHPVEIAGKSVLEVGSQNVNGSPREVLVPHGPEKYVGVDFAPGWDVDLVCDAGALVDRFGRDSFDVVVSTEMLEHAANWRAAVSNMKRVLRHGGLLVVTTRGPGFPRHSYPHDHWRFTIEDFRKIFADMVVRSLRPDPLPGHPGVLLKAYKPDAGLFQEIGLGPIEVERAP